MTSRTSFVANRLNSSQSSFFVLPRESFVLITIMVFFWSHRLVIFVYDGFFICGHFSILIGFFYFLRICFLSILSFNKTWRIETFVTWNFFYWRNAFRTLGIVAHINLFIFFLLEFQKTTLFWRFSWLVTQVWIVMFGVFRSIAALIPVI